MKASCLCKVFRCSDVCFRLTLRAAGDLGRTIQCLYSLQSNYLTHTCTTVVDQSTVYFRPTWHPAGPLGWYSSKSTLFIFELHDTCLHNWSDNSTGSQWCYADVVCSGTAWLVLIKVNTVCLLSTHLHRCC